MITSLTFTLSLSGIFGVVAVGDYASGEVDTGIDEYESSESYDDSYDSSEPDYGPPGPPGPDYGPPGPPGPGYNPYSGIEYNCKHSISQVVQMNWVATLRQIMKHFFPSVLLVIFDLCQ